MKLKSSNMLSMKQKELGLDNKRNFAVGLAFFSFFQKKQELILSFEKNSFIKETREVSPKSQKKLNLDTTKKNNSLAFFLL